MNYIPFLIVSIIFNALANILLKIGMIKAGNADTIIHLLRKVLFNPIIIGGVVCFTLGFFCYCYVLGKVNLSIAYPIVMSVGYMIVIIMSWIMLKETIVFPQVIGFILIMAGVWLVAK